MSGSAGPLGPDAEHLKDMCMRHRVASERLREAIATLTEWMANEHMPWAACRALRACRLVALDKQPGVRPVGIGETISRLMSKVVLHLCGRQATSLAGNLNLCAGLSAGIEGAVHALRARTREGCSEIEQPPLSNPGEDVTSSGDEKSEEPLLHESEGSMSVGGEPTQLDPVTQEGADLPDLIPRLVKVMVGDGGAEGHGGCKDADSDPDRVPSGCAEWL